MKSSIPLVSISLFCIWLKVRCQHFSCFSQVTRESWPISSSPKTQTFLTQSERFWFVLCTFQTAVWRSWLKLKVKAVPTLKGHEAQPQAVKLFQMSVVLVSIKFCQNEAQNCWRQLTQNIYSCKETSLHNMSGSLFLFELKKKILLLFMFPTTRSLATQGYGTFSKKRLKQM